MVAVAAVAASVVVVVAEVAAAAATVVAATVAAVVVAAVVVAVAVAAVVAAAEAATENALLRSRYGQRSSRDSVGHFLKAASMRSVIASITRTRARCLSFASITCHGANDVLVRSIMSPAATT